MKQRLSFAVLVAFLVCLGHSSAALAQSISVLVAYYSGSGNTEKMAQGVTEGAKSIPGANVTLKRVGDVSAEDLLGSDAVIVGSPVYFGNMAGEVKAFLDSWLKMGLFQERKMRNKVGGAFATGGGISNGKEFTVVGIHSAMLVNQMIIASGNGGFGATATTGPDSPGIDDKEMAEANALGKRIAEVTALVKRGNSK